LELRHGELGPEEVGPQKLRERAAALQAAAGRRGVAWRTRANWRVCGSTRRVCTYADRSDLRAG
jgi:hypothetical protein